MSLDANLVKNIKLISSYQHLPLKIHEMMNISEKTLERLIRSEEITDYEALEKLALCLNLSISDLCELQITYEQLDRVFKSNSVLPEKYLHLDKAYARSKTVKNIVQYLNQNIDLNYGNILTHRLGVSTSLFDDPNAKIHPQLVMDALAETQKLHLTPELLKVMGQNSELLSENNRYGRELRKLKEMRSIFEYIHEEVIKNEYDNLFKYNILAIKKDKAVITILPKPDAHETLKKKLIGNRELCLYKQGVYLSFLRYKGIKEARLKECSCLYQNGNECRYEITWENKEQISDENLLQ